MTSTITVTMLGNFTLAQEDVTPVVQANLSGRSRRLWLLIAYLIYNRSRGVSPQELIDLLWPEANSSDPLATLQNNVSRARSMLAKAGMSDPRSLIKYEDGLYRWAPDADTQTDYDLFERYVRECDETPENCELALQAFSLYQGDFLEQASGEAWCINPSIYYRSLFMRLCSKTVESLLGKGRIDEVEQLCLRAIDVDPSVEQFSIVLMHVLTYCGQPQRALDHFERIKKLFEDEYGVKVSSELELERVSAMHALYGSEMSEQAVRDFLNEPTGEDGAFYCNNSVFREIVQLQMRDVQRNETTAQIVALTLSQIEADYDREQLTTDMLRLENTLSSTLRSGDPFTKVGTSQFLIMLTTATRQNAEDVMKRVGSRFMSEYPQVKAEFNVSFFPIESFQ